MARCTPNSIACVLLADGSWFWFFCCSWGSHCGAASTPPARRLRARAALCTAALLAPWASYPAVFVLGAASLALLVRPLRRRRLPGFFWAAVTALLVLSGFMLWLAAVRHQATPSLHQFWA